MGREEECCDAPEKTRTTRSPIISHTNIPYWYANKLALLGFCFLMLPIFVAHQNTKQTEDKA